MPVRKRALFASLILPSLLFVALASGCLIWYVADDPYSGGPLDGGSDAAQVCIPTPSQKVCVGICYEQSDPAVGCSGPCTACDTPQNGQPKCVVRDSGETCALGICNAQYADCNNDASDGCETQTTTTENCGSCGHDCKPLPFCNPPLDGGDGYECSNVCPQPPYLQCGAECILPLSDPKNCGVCGNDCTASNGDGTCDGGACFLTCNAGYCLSQNKKKCVLPGPASPNCGACGVDCRDQPGKQCCTKAGVSSCAYPSGFGPDSSFTPPGGGESCQP